MVLPSELEGTKDENAHRLERLHHWLTLEGATAVLIPSLFFLPGVVVLLKWAAIAFTPYMLWRLYQARRYGWIATFLIVVVIPILVIPAPTSATYGFIIGMLPLFLFYTYTWILRHAVGQWLLEERSWYKADS